MEKMKYFSMFSGIGGFEYGIRQASNDKWECVGYSEIDKYAIATYQQHFPNHKNWGDCKAINPAELPDFDMLCGGFPCQSFSIAGKRKGFQDTRGTLFHEILRIAKHKRPRLLFLENVKGLLSADSGRCFATIISSLDELGYDVEWQVLNSKYFGVPQNRERVFIIGHLRGTPFKQVFPIRQEYKEYEIENGEKPEKAMEISGTINTGYGNSRLSGETYILHSLMPRSSETKQGGSGHLQKEDGTTYCLDSGNCQAIEYAQALQTDGVLRTGSSWGTNNPQSSRNIRRLTPIECERLQGFPDSWTIGSDTQRYKQCGNAVTTNIIKAIVEDIICQQ